MTPTGVLVITQDTWLAESVRSTLPGPEFETHLAGRATGAVELARRLRPDVVVIDLELRTVDAAEVCRALVERFDAPVLGLASSDPGARVAFLSAGGHGCVRKPMNHSELEALIRAHASRKEDAPRPAILRCGGLEIDLAAMEARQDGQPLRLTLTEFRLLADLVAHQGEVRTYEDLRTAGWGTRSADAHTIQYHVENLREKLEPSGAARLQIQAVRGVGYRLESTLASRRGSAAKP